VNRTILLALILGLVAPVWLLAHEPEPGGGPWIAEVDERSEERALEPPADLLGGRLDAGARPDTIQEIRLVDGSVVRGTVLSETDDRVVIQTLGGIRMELERGQIRSMRAARGEVRNGEFWRQDPNRTRLFFAPTARPMAKGEGYVASYMLFFPFVGYGATDRVTLAGGTPIIPGLIGRAFYLAPKITLMSQPGMDVAVGTIALFATEALDEGSVGVVYGNGTFGGQERSLTAGLGWGFQMGGGSSRLSNDPVLMVGGDVRTGEQTKLLTENWFGGGSGVLTGGIRFFGERLSADLGFGLAVEDSGTSCCLPLVNFVYSFGGTR